MNLIIEKTWTSLQAFKISVQAICDIYWKRSLKCPNITKLVWQYVNEMVWINDLEKTCFSYDTTISIRNLKAQFNDCVKGLPDIPLCGKREIVDHLNNSTSKCKSNYQCYFRCNKIFVLGKNVKTTLDHSLTYWWKSSYFWPNHPNTSDISWYQ